MKIRAEHTFYLEHELPSFDYPDGLRLGVQYREHMIYIIGWDRREPLFNGELGETMRSAEFVMQPADGRDGAIVRRPRENVVDKLLIIIEMEAEESDLSDSRKLANSTFEEAVSIANFTIEHLRVVTGSGGIKRIPATWNPDSRSYGVTVPNTVSWFRVEDSLVPLPMYDGVNSTSSAGAVKTPFNGHCDSQELEASLATGFLPSFPKSLLVDAFEALVTMQYREAIIQIATACESQALIYRTTQTEVPADEVEGILRKKRSFAAKNFDLIPLRVCQKSLRQADRAAFEDVEGCYRERNNIMHEGKPSDEFRDLSLTNKMARVSQWRESAKRAVDWMGKLPLAAQSSS